MKFLKHVTIELIFDIFILWCYYNTSLFSMSFLIDVAYNGVLPKIMHNYNNTYDINKFYKIRFYEIIACLLLIQKVAYITKDFILS